MVSKHFSAASSGLERAGTVTGRLLGRAVAGAEIGLAAIGAFASGHFNEGMKLAGEACKASFFKGDYKQQMAFADSSVDTPKLSTAFKQGIKDGAAEGQRLAKVQTAPPAFRPKLS